MRISDWSSDVCSSDLPDSPRNADGLRGLERGGRDAGTGTGLYRQVRFRPSDARSGGAGAWGGVDACQPLSSGKGQPARTAVRRVGQRSEEHTSELQSIMRISYAVFCLKKKKTKK